MRKRVMVWVALAQFLPLLAIGDGSNMARAADECRSGPSGRSPSGSHWFYRIDRATKRKCWYLGPVGERTRASTARSSRRAVAAAPDATAAAAPITPPPAANTVLRDPNAESFAETTLQPRPVTSSTVEGPRRAINRAPIVARDQAGDDRTSAVAANEMPLVWPAPASAAADAAVGETTVAAADSSLAAPAPAAATPAAAAIDAAPPAPSLAATTVAAKAAPVAASAPAVAAVAPVASAPTASAAAAPAPMVPAAQSSVSVVKLIFIFTFLASSLALVVFLGRGLIDYVIARRANRRAAQRARPEVPWPAWTAAPPPAMPYMHAPNLTEDFEPTPARPVQDRAPGGARTQPVHGSRGAYA